jgi:hypothetical protein
MRCTTVRLMLGAAVDFTASNKFHKYRSESSSSDVLVNFHDLPDHRNPYIQVQQSFLALFNQLGHSVYRFSLGTFQRRVRLPHSIVRLRFTSQNWCCLLMSQGMRRARSQMCFPSFPIAPASTLKMYTPPSRPVRNSNTAHITVLNRILAHEFSCFF